MNGDVVATKTALYGDGSEAPIATCVPFRKSRRVILRFMRPPATQSEYYYTESAALIRDHCLRDKSGRWGV